MMIERLLMCLPKPALIADSSYSRPIGRLQTFDIRHDNTLALCGGNGTAREPVVLHLNKYPRL